MKNSSEEEEARSGEAEGGRLSERQEERFCSLYLSAADATARAGETH